MKQGFTVIEVIVVVLFLAVASIVLFFQLSNMSIEAVNSEKKIAINAMYYSLEEQFHPKHGFYPEFLEDDTLPTMDSALLTDPYGVRIGEVGSAYRYEPTNCSDGECTAYTLRVSLDGEADFIKESRNGS